ncbi:MAG: CDP-alcohol phosphatidyltransferase family protein [Burkholderiales bacterium]|nr:CDP-alcohol phosphatidyltransferase family protein [Phycisphaerae bacterium]
MNYRQIPNLITTARLILAVVFFVILSWYQFEGRGHSTLLTLGFFICLVAVSTDYLDGYLARKWNVESGFGRVVDPFVDKILVLGSFIFFAGKNFIISEAADPHPYVVRTITGITPAMVVVILGRELLVTSLRGLAEKSGVSFGADKWGKLKMVMQSITILVIVAFVYFLGVVQKHFEGALVSYRFWAEWFRDIMIWLTLIITVISAWGYLSRSIQLMRSPSR